MVFKQIKNKQDETNTSMYQIAHSSNAHHSHKIKRAHVKLGSTLAFCLTEHTFTRDVPRSK